MRIDFDASRTNIAIIPDVGEEITFDILVYKLGKSRDTDVFSTVNGYLQTLPRDTRISIYDIYAKAAEVLDRQHYVDRLDSQLEDLLKNLVELIDLQRLSRYIQTDSGIIIPSDVKTDFADVSDMYGRSRTYLRHEYIDLLTVLIALRFVLPIWSVYMTLIQEIVASNTRELRAYSLLRKSAIATHPAYARLLVYIEDWFNPTVKTTSATVSGIGRSEIPEWLCALVMVRRLPVIDVTNSGNGPNVINRLSAYVKDSINNLEKKFKERIKSKKQPGESKAVDRDPSFMETYRVKQDIPYGDIVAHDVWLTNILNACRAIVPTIDPQLVAAVLEVTDELELEELAEHNIILTQWVLDNAVPAPIIHALEKRSVVAGMIITQCICHHWKLHTLALLATGINTPRERDTLIDSHLSIPDDIVKRLEEIYPYQRIPHRSERGSKSKGPTLNYGIVTVSDMAVKLSKNIRRVRVPRFLTNRDVPVNTKGELITPKNIIVDLAILLIKLDEI